MASEIDAIKQALPPDDVRKAELLDRWVALARDERIIADVNIVKTEFPENGCLIAFALVGIYQEAEKADKTNSYQTPQSQQGKKRNGQEISNVSVNEGARADLLREYVEPKGSASTVDLLDDGIKQLIKDSCPGNKMAPFLFLLQSMGYGKTRAMLELAKHKRRAVYLPCKDLPTLSGDNKFWHVPSSLQKMLTILQNQGDENLCEIKWIKFLEAVQSCADEYATPADLYKAQVTEKGKLGDFYGKLHDKYSPSPINEQKRTWQRSAVRSSEKHQRSGVSFQEESQICYENAKAISDSSLVVCLDEATALPKPSFRAFRRAAKHLGIIIIFSDTTASISEIMPAKDSSSSLEGGELGHFTAPIYQISNFDLEWNSGASTQDLANLFRAGRPRWSSLLQAIQRESTNASQSREGDHLRDLVKTVVTLLARDDGIEEGDRPQYRGNLPITNILPNMVAIFVCRFGLGSQSKIAPLLAKYSLATVDHVTENRDFVSTHYPSEPVLAEASAQYTKTEVNLNKVLEHVHAAVVDNLLAPPRGDLGEMCAAALLGLTMDKIRSGKSDFKFFSAESVELKQFLSYFCKDTDETQCSAALEGWEVNFTHFVRPPYNLDQNDLAIMWNRRMAYYVLQGMKGLDLLIAMHHKEKGHATLRVQIKNYAAHFTVSKRNEALDKLTPRYCPPAVPEEKFSVGLLLCAGTVDDYCALVHYDDVNQAVRPCQVRSTRQTSKPKPQQKLFLQIASSFLGTGLNSSIAEKLRKICQGSETTGDWDVSRNSIERCKRESCKSQNSS